MTISLAGVIDELKTGTYTVTRPGPGTYVNGVWVTAAPVAIFPIVANVGSPTAQELQKLPEAQQVEDVRSIRTVTELKARTAQNAGDQVAIAGEVFEVFTVGSMSDGDEVLWRALASRVGALGAA